jgi:methylenetetrahydrofolate dehydrogenase (NADP+)/methenyltetrahydrofolate cyclohydrolase
MTMILLDGKALSDTIKDELRTEVSKHIANGQRPPHLVAILVGENPASQTYVANKVRACEYCRLPQY